MSKDEIIKICEQYSIENYTINSDMTIDVIGSVSIHYRQLTKMPLTFGKVKGTFDCSGNDLISLKGCPNYVGGRFYCHNNDLTSVEYCPQYIGGMFYCLGNNINTRQAMINVNGHIYSKWLWKF